MALAQLCGSVNLEDAETVFRVVADISGDTVKRMPDGETGDRQGWILAQIPRLDGNPMLERAQANEHVYITLPRFRLRPGAEASELRVDLGYANEAVRGYTVFRALKEQGVVGTEVRFQVSLPTQLAITLTMFEDDLRQDIGPRLEQALGAEIDRIVETVPADELAVQWDVAIEMACLEGMGNPAVGEQEIVEQLVRLAKLLPDAVELGFHLCYGDAPTEPGGQGRHFMEPSDTSVLVRLANAISSSVSRPIAWLHMPVPIDRSDDAYFRPLSGLQLDPDTQLFLGLVHQEDGLAGTQRRIACAARYVRGFGIATECGMGRRPREAIPLLLEIQRDAVVPD